MDPAAFSCQSPGTLIPAARKQFAFVPAPLPPKLDLAALAVPMAAATAAVGELKGACRRLQNPSILVSPLQRQEALTSSAMEGTYSTADRLLLADVGREGNVDEPTREVSNYLNALNHAVQMLKTLPLSHRVLQAAHTRLLSGLSSARGAQKRPGEYKREQNWIGGITIEVARFVPPPPAETQRCMDDLERYLNREDRSFPTSIIDLALVHYQLEAIHPFADGNGRVGRMLISLMAVTSGLLDMPVLYVSPSLERKKDLYIDLMFKVSTHGRWSDWLTFFFDIVVESCRQTIATIDRLISLQSEYRNLAMGAGRSTAALQLVDALFNHPALEIMDAARVLGVTYPAAKKAVDKLAAANILIPIANTYPRLFYAPAIWGIAEVGGQAAESQS